MPEERCTVEEEIRQARAAAATLSMLARQLVRQAEAHRLAATARNDQALAFARDARLRAAALSPGTPCQTGPLLRVPDGWGEVPGG